MINMYTKVVNNKINTRIDELIDIDGSFEYPTNNN